MHDIVCGCIGMKKFLQDQALIRYRSCGGDTHEETEQNPVTRQEPEFTRTDFEGGTP